MWRPCVHEGERESAAVILGGMSADRAKMSFSSVVSLGVGTMIGAGIFALLGQAGTMAGSAVWVSFLIGGFIALLTGYSLGKLGARYPSAGGIAEYLIHGYGNGLFAGAMSCLLYAAALVSLSLVAKTFGSYGANLLSGDAPGWLPSVLAIAVVAVFVAINLGGSGSVGKVEVVIVIFKFLVLVTLCVGGLFALHPKLLAPSTYPPAGSVLASIAVTFFAYEGFRVITNAAEEVDDPKHTIPRAITTAIVLVLGLYLLVSVIVFGTLTSEEVRSASDNALAAAARPVFGQAGFVAVSITALVATASAINASLFAVTNVAYQMAKDGELPGRFGTPVRHSREGLLISGLIVAVLAATLDLRQIAVLGAASILLVHATVHAGHIRLTDDTGASKVVVATAALLSIGAIVFTLIDASRPSFAILEMFAGVITAAFAFELWMRRHGDRQLKTRTV